MLRPRQLASWLGTLFLICGEVRGLGDAVVYAVNCGGEAHTDMLGVKYERDDNRHGTPSDYGKQLMIGRVSQQDQILYQVSNDFLTLVLKIFCDIFFSSDGAISHFDIRIRHARSRGRRVFAHPEIQRGQSRMIE